MPSKIVKSFRRGFILDSAKLIRIVNIIEQRFTDSNVKFAPMYEVALKNGKRLELGNVEEVLQLDNGVRNPIISLYIRAWNIEDRSDNIKTGCLVDFMGEPFTEARIRVDSETAKHANQLFAELEEQVERTLQGGAFQRLRTPTAIFYFVAALTMSFMVLAVSTRPPTVKYITIQNQQDIEYLIGKQKAAKTPEEKIDFLYEMQGKQLAAWKESARGFSIQDLLTLKVVIFSLPILLIIGSFIYIFAYTYPKAVFLWGDYGEYYNQLVNRRKNLWYVVIVSLILGIIGNLFVYSIGNYLK